MALLSAADIKAIKDTRSETVPVPEWGGEVIIRSMSGTERDEFEAEMWKSGSLDRRNYRSRFLVRVLMTEGGARLFTDADAAELGKRNAGVIDRLYDIAGGMSGLSEQAVEAIEGNSATDGTADGAASSSGSPATSEA